MTTGHSPLHYTFGSFEFDPATGELRKDGGSVKLRLQASRALELLLSHRGGIVTKNELREALWPDERVVSFEASIAAVVRELRRALGDNPKTPHFIETIPKRGYRFLPPVIEQPDTPALAASRRSPRAIGGGFLRASAGVGMAMVVLLLGGTVGVQPRLSSPPLNTDPVTVAVLPFDDLTEHAAQRILAQTLPVELIGWLGPAAPERLRAIDRNGAAAGQKADRARPVDFVLHGSVRDDRDAVVISARLLSEAGGEFIWGESYRRVTDDIGLTAREVTARIAGGVLAHSLPGQRVGSSAAANEAAAAAYRRGVDSFALLSREGTNDAANAFRQATELDPGFAAAYARLAETLIDWRGPAVTPDRVRVARKAALRSVELDPINALGHRVLGQISFYFDRDWRLAGSRLERSVELSPPDASGHHSFAAWLSARGRHDMALREIDLAGALEPESVAISMDVMLLHFYAGDFEGTVRSAQRLKELWPHNEASHRYIVLSRLAMNDASEAASEARARLIGTDQTRAAERSVSKLSDADALTAYWQASLRAVRRAVDERSGDPTPLAVLYLQLGETDAALDALETAIGSPRFSYFVPYLGVSPGFEGLHGHPRFERMLRALDQFALNRETVRAEAAVAGSHSTPD